MRELSRREVRLLAGDLNRGFDVVVRGVAVEEERDVGLIQGPRRAGPHTDGRHLIEVLGIFRTEECRPGPRKSGLELGVAGQHERGCEGEVALRHAGAGCGLPLANHCTGPCKRGYGVAEAVGLTPRQNLVRDVLAPLEAALHCCPVVVPELSERQRALLVEPAELRRIERFQGHVRSLNDRGAAVRSARRPVGHEDRLVCREPDAVLRVEHRGVHGRRHADGLRIAEGAGDDRVEHHLVPDEGFIDLRPDLRGMGLRLRRLLAHGAGQTRRAAPT